MLKTVGCYRACIDTHSRAAAKLSRNRLNEFQLARYRGRQPAAECRYVQVISPKPPKRRKLIFIGLFTKTSFLHFRELLNRTRASRAIRFIALRFLADRQCPFVHTI